MSQHELSKDILLCIAYMKYLSSQAQLKVYAEKECIKESVMLVVGLHLHRQSSQPTPTSLQLSTYCRFLSFCLKKLESICWFELVHASQPYLNVVKLNLSWNLQNQIVKCHDECCQAGAFLVELYALMTIMVLLNHRPFHGASVLVFLGQIWNIQSQFHQIIRS